MNAPRSEQLIYPEDALNPPGSPYARLAVEMARIAPLNPLTERSTRLPQQGHARFDLRFAFEPRLRAGVPIETTVTVKPRKIHHLHSAIDRCSARMGHPQGSRLDCFDPPLEPIATEDILELDSMNIQRITDQAGVGWGDRPAHEHLAVTERNWSFSPSVRHLRVGAATTTVGTALPGNSSAVGDS